MVKFHLATSFSGYDLLGHTHRTGPLLILVEPTEISNKPMSVIK